MEVACSDILIHIKMSSVHWSAASSATNSVWPSASQQCCQHYSAGNSAQERNKFDWCRPCLKCDGTHAETRFRLSAKQTSPFKSAGRASVQSTTGSRVVSICGGNAGYSMFRGSVKGTGYPLHSPCSPSLPLPCVTVCHHISTGLYHMHMLCLTV